MFDPSTMTVTAGYMSSWRTGHTATLLPSGKVLVAGGSVYPGGTSLASAELYDPATNLWTSVASMPSPRSHAAAVLLTDGRVLVVGGSSNGSNPPGAEIYDPPSDTWSSVVGIPGDTRPYTPTATRLPDGKVLIVGGSDNPQEAIADQADIFDPVTGSISVSRFRPVGGGRIGATATLLGDGTVIIVGGQGPLGDGNTTDIYDPSAEACTAVNCSAFSAGPRTNDAHCDHTATLLTSGLLLVVGGQCGASSPTTSSELYDPGAKKWSPASQPSDPRALAAAGLLQDGRVLVAGGVLTGGQSFVSSIEIYTPA